MPSTRILLLTHAPLAHALRQCALHVFPDCAADVLAIDVQPNENPADTLAAARIALEQDGDRPTLVMTDVFGATPCNVAQKLVDGVSAKLLTGVNLPMLLRTVCYRQETLDALVTRALNGATQGIMQVAITAPQNQRQRRHDPNSRDHQQ
ncbi:MAG: PTS fructose transporter subunit IIA [Alphaproteobacteria bacterium]|nr:PTS fructose transporter subunit IIA [Alphaproteobacteria bacterium]